MYRKTWLRSVLAVAGISLWLVSGQVVAQAATSAPATRSHKQSSSSSQGTVVLRGDLGSTVTLSMTGAFSVGRAENLTWNLPLVTAAGSNGYQQDVLSETFHFSVPPDSSTDSTIDGRATRSFHWDNPPANTVIHLVQSLKLHIVTTLSSFNSSAAYPLGQIPSDVRPYMKTTASLRLPTSAGAQVRAFAAHKQESAVVGAVSNWVASTLRYDAGTVGQAQGASTVLARRTAVCQGYANLTAGLLRKLGIPAQVVYGWVSPNPISIPGSRNAIQWSDSKSGDFHTWLNIYFPGKGWVPFDPQLEKFFVDPRHVSFFTGADAVNPSLGSWSADQVGSASPTGRPLAGGESSFTPGDGVFSKVTIANSDSFSLRVDRVIRDVKSLTLFSR